RGREVDVVLHSHRRGEPVDTRDRWPRPSLVFTEHGSWSVRSAAGGGDVHAGVLLAGAGGADYDCAHPAGDDGSSVAVLLPPGTAPVGALLTPVTPTIAALRRDLRRTLDEPGAVDALGWALWTAVADPGVTRVSPHARHVAARLRDVLDHEHTDPAL